MGRAGEAGRRGAGVRHRAGPQDRRHRRTLRRPGGAAHPGLRELTTDAELVALRLLIDRRDELSRTRVATANRAHRLFAELVPGGAGRDLSVIKAKAMLAGVRPRDLAGRTRRQVAGELVAELAEADAKLKVINRRLKAAVLARGSHPMDPFGIGPAGAAGDPGRRRRRDPLPRPRALRVLDRHRAPPEASSGDLQRHRLSRAGNRRLNHVLHMAAVVQLRHDTAGRAHYRRKLADGKGALGALRCLRRRISDSVYRQLLADAQARQRCSEDEAGPGGHSGATTKSSAADLTPVIGTSDQSLPGPAPATLDPARRSDLTPAASAAAAPRRRARGVKTQRPTGRTVLTPTSTGAP